MMLQGVIQNLRGYWFDSKLTLIMISLPQPHRTPQNVGEGYSKVILQSVILINQDIYRIMHTNYTHILLKIVSREGFFCHYCNLLDILFIKCCCCNHHNRPYTTLLELCEFYMRLNLRATDTEGKMALIE